MKNMIRRLSKRKEDRERKFGAIGRPFKLDTRERILMLLVYYHLYITYTLAGFLCDLDESRLLQRHSKDWILNMLRKCLPIPQKMYNVAKRIQTPEEVEKHFPGIAPIDCTEQPISRPADKRRKKMYYSGKKERHKISCIIRHISKFYRLSMISCNILFYFAE